MQFSTNQKVIFMVISKTIKYFLILFFFCSLKGICFNQSYDEIYKRGLELYKKKNYVEAEICFKEALKFEKNQDKVHYLIGMCCAFQEQTEQAEHHLLVSLKFNDRFEESYLGLGEIYFIQKDYKKAERLIKKAIQINPDNAYSHDFLGTLYFINDLTSLALFEWNKIDKPVLNRIVTESHDYYKKDFLMKELNFHPGQLIRPSMVRESMKRLERIGNISNISFNLVPQKNSDVDFNCQVSFFEETGFARNPLFFFINLLRDISHKMLHMEYKSIADVNINAYSTYRFDEYRKKFGFHLTFPRFLSIPLYFSLDYENKSDTWNIRSVFPEHINFDHQIKTREFTIRFDYIHNDRMSYSHYWKVKNRTSEDVADLTFDQDDPFFYQDNNALLSGGELSVDLIHNLSRDMYSNFSLSYDVSIRKHGNDSRFAKVMLTIENGKLWRKNLSKEVGSKFVWRMKFGSSSGQVPLEEKFILGFGPDTENFLRAHSVTHAGKLGYSPVVDKFFLSNLEYMHHLFAFAPFRIEGGVFVDWAYLFDDHTFYSGSQSIVDVGIFSRITLFKFPFIFSYGHNFKEDKNYFYFGSNLNF